MKEIREYIFDTLVADPSLQTLTGYAAGDQRIYLDWPPNEVNVSTSLPGYISYKLSSINPIDYGEYVEPAQEDDIIVDVNVWARTPDDRDNIAERIGVLFKDHSFYTSSFRVLFTRLETKEDIEEIHEETGQIQLWRKFMQFRMGPIYRL